MDYSVRKHAADLSHDPRRVFGPLNGYHHEAYVFSLSDREAQRIPINRVKLRVPRQGLVRFDHRYFRSEEALLETIRGRIANVPEVIITASGEALQRFVEGRTLGECRGVDNGLSELHFWQLNRLFRELSLFNIAAIYEESGRCGAPCINTFQSQPDGNSQGFLAQLVDFTNDIYMNHGKPWVELFAQLGINADPLEQVREHLSSLSDRPFVLLHGDLHPENIIVDARGDLWFIDWELAMVGDPLYDLATHLHLTSYTPKVAADVANHWASSVGCAKSRGWQADLPLVLAYKRSQSLYTDVIRAAMRLTDERSTKDLQERLDIESAGILAVIERARYGLNAAGLRSNVLPHISLDQVRHAYRSNIEFLKIPGRVI